MPSQQLARRTPNNFTSIAVAAGFPLSLHYLQKGDAVLLAGKPYIIHFVPSKHGSAYDMLSNDMIYFQRPEHGGTSAHVGWLLEHTLQGGLEAFSSADEAAAALNIHAKCKAAALEARERAKWQWSDVGSDSSDED